MKLSQLITNKRKLAINIDDETLNVVYRPGAVTPEAQDAFMDDVTEQRLGRALALFLPKILIDWDLEGDEGVYPLDPESLMVLPTPFLNTIFTALVADAGPNATKPAASEGGSLAGA